MQCAVAAGSLRFVRRCYPTEPMWFASWITCLHIGGLLSLTGSSDMRWIGSMDDWDPSFRGAINMMAASADLAAAVLNKNQHGLPTFWGDACFPGATNCSGRGGPVQGPNGCLKNGGCWRLADGGWEKAVEAELAGLQPLIQNRTVEGIFVGDEMVCNGLPFDNFTALVSLIRAKVGPTLKLWANECCGTIVGAKGGPGEWLHIPPELDYISYDCYSVPEAAGDGSYRWNGSAEVAIARAAYEREIYPLLHPHQRVMQIPGLFGWNKSQCPVEQQTSALLDKLDSYWSWAQEDTRVVGMTPWHLNDRSLQMGPNLGPGAINFPAVLTKLRWIDTQISNTSLPPFVPPPSPTPLPPPPVSPPINASLVALFPRGEGDVDCYFGPILFAVPGTSTLLALAEARLFSCNDAGPKRIAMRRSADNGVVWDPISFIWNDTALPTLVSKDERWAQWNRMGGTNFTGSNFGSMFYDSTQRTLSLYFTYGEIEESEVSMLIIQSKDYGKTWNDRHSARNVTASIQASGTIRVFFGMVNGIELDAVDHTNRQNGRDESAFKEPLAHRLIVPGWALLNKTGASGKYDVSGSALMYSDDHGITWQVGEVLTKGAMGIENTQPSESTVVELTNGSLLVNIRDSLNVLDGGSDGKTRCGCRLVARSDDRGATWARLWQEPDLLSSGVEGSMIATTVTGKGSIAAEHNRTKKQRQRIWFSNPRSKTSRVNGTIYYSDHEGAPGSWEVGCRVPGQVWHAGPGRPHDTFNFGYNMMVALPSNTRLPEEPEKQTFGVLYQNGWVGNAGTHFAFECDDPCCGPSSEHQETKLCGVVFARFESVIRQPSLPTGGR